MEPLISSARCPCDEIKIVNDNLEKNTSYIHFSYRFGISRVLTDHLRGSQKNICTLEFDCGRSRILAADTKCKLHGESE